MERIEYLIRKDERLEDAFWAGYAWGAPKELKRVSDGFVRELRQGQSIKIPDKSELMMEMHRFSKVLERTLRNQPR